MPYRGFNWRWEPGISKPYASGTAGYLVSAEAV
jgi:hypothetical protein